VLGDGVGALVGDAVGDDVGDDVGDAVGDDVGDEVAVTVGAGAAGVVAEGVGRAAEVGVDVLLVSVVGVPCPANATIGLTTMPPMASKAEAADTGMSFIRILFPSFPDWGVRAIYDQGEGPYLRFAQETYVLQRMA
jgi:hypothetical protein